MARIRSLKPEFWTDSVIVGLSAYARLLYMGTWNHADEYGVIEDDPMQLRLRILPADPVNAEELVDELVKAGRLLRATTPDGAKVLVIRRFRDHQVFDARLKPRFGDPSNFTYETAGNEVAPHTSDDMRPHVGTSDDISVPYMGQVLGSGVRGQVLGSGVRDARETRTSADKGRRPPTTLPDTWTPNEKHRSLAATEGVDLDRETAKFQDHAHATDRRMRDWDATFRVWLRRAHDYGGGARASPNGREPSTSTDPADWLDPEWLDRPEPP